MAPETVEAGSPTPAATAVITDEVKPYRIHVSSRYLDLTRQKLEITRLPRESALPRSRFWWTPKPQVEPLIDFWLEQYSWRAQEDALNTQVPQFRTSFPVPSSPSPSSSSPATETETSAVRIHFIHARSPRANAVPVPVLLIPPFPASNLSFGHLIKHFTEPEDDSQQAFHLVIPALPGLGFSDALPSHCTAAIPTTARLLDALMRRLGYRYYLATNASAGSASPAGIDYRLARHLATRHAGSCLGTHLISPPLARPKFGEAPVEWAKYSVANLFRAPVLGYQAEDFAAMRRIGGSGSSSSSNSNTKNKNKKTQQQQQQQQQQSRAPPSSTTMTPTASGLHNLALREPNALAYALCDSPTGLLVYTLMILRLLDPRAELAPTEVINLTHLAWLPGPEAAMRFWANCAQNPEQENSKNGVQQSQSQSEDEAEAEAEAEVEADAKSKASRGSKKRKSTSKSKPRRKPKVAITVFLGGDDGVDDVNVSKNAAGGDGEDEADAEAETQTAAAAPEAGSSRFHYSCPSWASANNFDVVHTRRAPGKPGLLAWKRPELIVDGVRGLAAAILKADARLRGGVVEPATAAAGTTTTTVPPALAPLDKVVTGGENDVNSTKSNGEGDGDFPAPLVASTSASTQASIPAPNPTGLTHLAPPSRPVLGDSKNHSNNGRLQPLREISGETAVGSNDSISPLKNPSPAVSASVDFAPHQPTHAQLSSHGGTAGTPPSSSPLAAPPVAVTAP